MGTLSRVSISDCVRGGYFFGGSSPPESSPDEVDCLFRKPKKPPPRMEKREGCKECLAWTVERLVRMRMLPISRHVNRE